MNEQYNANPITNVTTVIQRIYNFITGRIKVEADAQGAVVVVPSDATDLILPTKTPARGIYVGATGNLTVTLADGSKATFTGLAAGMIHPITATKVWATGTTATSLLAVY